MRPHTATTNEANTYSYVGGNPVNYYDPLGLTPAGAAIGGRIGWWVGAAAGEAADPAGGGIPGAALGGLAGRAIGDAISNIMNASSLPPGFWPGDKGGEEWGRRNGVGAKEGRRRFHGVKQSCTGSRPKDVYGVNPETGDVVDPNGDPVGNLGEAKPK